MKAIEEALQGYHYLLNERNYDYHEPIIQKARAELAEIKEQLNTMEWQIDCSYGTYECPCCGAHKEDGHEPNCWLAKVIETK
jgi:hypothetical protein